MKKRYIMSPGPTSIPQEVSLAEACPIVHHRTVEYERLFASINEDLMRLFQTRFPVYTFASSGTGAMEAGVVSLLSPGDYALVVVGGKFGERWAEICKAYGIEVVQIDVEWGRAVVPEEIKERLKKEPRIKAVYTTLCETSTGVLTDIKSIGKIVKDTDSVLVVDAISGLGADELKTDEWSVDVVVAGSQKGLMIPPGLAFISISDKAWRLVETSRLPKYYFSLKEYRKALEKGQNPYTPAVSLLYALRKSLDIIMQEGIENILMRHARLAEATRAGAKALSLELFSKSPSNALTPILSPPGIDGEEIVRRFQDDYGITVAEGQAHLKGKIFRIAHLGYADTFDVITAISALEMILKSLGYEVTLGAGVAAAQEALLK